MKINVSDIDIGTWVKQIADEQRWSYVDLAKAINCSRSSLYNMFNSRDISVLRLLKLSEVLGYDFIGKLAGENKDISCGMLLIPFRNGHFELENLPESILSEIKKSLHT